MLPPGPPPPAPAPPPPPLSLPPSEPRGPRKRFIVQAASERASEAAEAWFWLAALHLKHSPSSRGCIWSWFPVQAALGRGVGAELGPASPIGRDWAFMDDGMVWDCQTVICQSLAYRLKPERYSEKERAYDWPRAAWARSQGCFGLMAGIQLQI